MKRRVSSGLKKIIMGSVIMFSSITGCMKYQAARMPEIKIEECSYQIRDEDVQIGIEPFEKQKECEPIFNKPNSYQKDVLNEGILPLYVRLKNIGKKEIFLDPRGTQIVNENIVEWLYISAEEAAKMKETSKKKTNRTIAFIISPLGAAMGVADIERMNKERKKDYVEKSLKTHYAVLPSKELDGFIFLKSASEKATQEFYNMKMQGRLYLYIIKDGSRKKVELELNGKR